MLKVYLKRPESNKKMTQNIQIIKPLLHFAWPKPNTHKGKLERDQMKISEYIKSYNQKFRNDLCLDNG